MKLTKKAAALLLAASLAVSVCAMPVFATDPNMGSLAGATGTAAATGTETQVLYKVTKTFTWSVPATINFGEDAGVEKTPTVTTSVDQDETLNQTGKAAASTNNWQGTAPKVMVTKNVIGTKDTLKIQLKAKDGTEFKVKNGSGTDLEYKVETKKQKKDGAEVSGYTGEPVLANGSDILELSAGTNTGEVELEFVLTTEKIKKAETAGDYKDTITFTARIDTTT